MRSIGSPKTSAAPKVLNHFILPPPPAPPRRASEDLPVCGQAMDAMDVLTVQMAGSACSLSAAPSWTAHAPSAVLLSKLPQLSKAAQESTGLRSELATFGNASVLRLH